MPSFREQVEMLESWRRFPGVERLADDRVALTFDDGPDPDATPAILDALDAAGAKATFFVVGEQLMRHHAIARAARARGHELALHGATHPHLERLSPAAARDEIARGVGAFEAAVGERPALFRPPYGRFGEHAFAACRRFDLTPVYWSAWGGDWDPLPAERIAELAARDLSAGAIVLLHDSARYATRASAAPTAAAVAPIAAAAAEAGLAIGPVAGPPYGG
ncbi:MAG TPA: polysaccharide deacetylase family protein [Thermoleophilaceae bacterium]|jgi:peptidoglycan/xylan/chitin deacetylase (PgdA/CDA1 family)